MVEHYALYTIDNLNPGDHLCCIYQTDAEHRAVVTPFLRRGLEQNQKVMYIVDARTAETILGYLRDDGLEVKPYLDRGQFAIYSYSDTYMRDGVFDPIGMIALLRAETEQALAEGYAALRVTGEMTWVLRGLPGSDKLLEYEARLNDFFADNSCMAICQYDRRHFEAEILLDILRTHPIAAIGDQIYDNFYYIPPSQFLYQDAATATLARWINRLADRKQTEESLQESEAKYRSLFDHSLNGFALHQIVTDAQNRPVDYIFLEVNRAFEQLTGLNAGDILDKRVTEVIPGIEQEPFIERYGQVALTGRPTRFEQFAMALNKYYDIAAFSPRYGQFAVVFSDITEHKLAEQALKENEERYALAQRMANIGSWDWNIETGALHWSDQIEPMFGFNQGEFGRTYEAFLACVHPQDRQYVIDSVNACVEEDQEYAIEHRIVWPDGTVRWVAEMGDVIRDQSGRATRMLGIVQDITKRKQAEIEYRRLNQAIQQTAEGIVITDLQGVIQYINPSFEHITGYSSAEVIGRNPRILKSGKHDEVFYHEMWRTILAGKIWEGVLINRKKSGELCHEDMTIAPVLDDSGAIANFVAVKRDITERVRTEEAQRREILLWERLSAVSKSTITARMFGLTSLRESQPERFEELSLRYAWILDLALEQRVYKIDYDISKDLGTISRELGFFQAGPRDVIELHSLTLKKKMRDVSQTKAQAYVEEGRLMLIELMGYLVSYYRYFFMGPGQSDLPDAGLNKAEQDKR